jgi:uncharacterized membrane-anchored protein
MTPRASKIFFAVVALQMLGLMAFAGVKQYTVAAGTEVILQQATPVDPRSLMQGDYAILDYEIAVIPEMYEALFEPGDDVIVVLAERDQVWKATQYLTSDWDQRLRNEVFIRGAMQPNGRIDFGIGTYFVPEGTGKAIEWADDVKIRVSLSDDGDATVTGVILDGEDFSP